MEPINKIYTVTKFAERIGATRGVVLRMIKNGRILAFRLSDCKKSAFRIRESEIDRLISFELHKKCIDEKTK
ncbi:hypothetical protein [Methylobacter sp.]|uniref:hypothetical protein n=1 Tax=Methylobacter sp. TaxID=2051955 RepID=UPI003DA375A5